MTRPGPLFERLLKIGDEIVRAIEPDRQAQHPSGHARLGQAFIAEAIVRREDRQARGLPVAGEYHVRGRRRQQSKTESL